VINPASRRNPAFFKAADQVDCHAISPFGGGRSAGRRGLLSINLTSSIHEYYIINIHTVLAGRCVAFCTFRPHGCFGVWGAFLAQGCGYGGLSPARSPKNPVLAPKKVKKDKISLDFLIGVIYVYL